MSLFPFSSETPSAILAAAAVLLLVRTRSAQDFGIFGGGGEDTLGVSSSSGASALSKGASITLSDPLDDVGLSI